MERVCFEVNLSSFLSPNPLDDLTYSVSLSENIHKFS